MPVVIGVDGGGTKTKAIVADENGAELATAEGPGSAVRPGESERSAKIIAALVREAVASAGMPEMLPKVVCVGVAGVGREAEQRALTQALLRLDVAEDVLVLPDATIALEDAFVDGPGILLIAGTGSVAFGRGPTGTFARCGGWGPTIGDEGGGAWIGRRALSIVAAATDSREPETALVGAVLTAIEINDPLELIPWAAAATPAKLATLAPAVMSAAEGGDLRANALLSIAVEELVLHVRALARSLFGDERNEVPVALAGGLLARRSVLRKRLEHRLKSAVPGAQVRTQDVEPARGAVRAALRLMEMPAVES